MFSDTLVSYFHYTLFEYNRTHTSGSTVLFVRPCIGYVLKGSAQFLYKGQNYYAFEGDLIYIAKGTKYYSVWTGDPEVKFYSIDFSFAKPYSLYEYRFQIVENYPRVLFDKIYETFGSTFECMPYFYSLLSDIYTKMTAETAVSASVTAVQPAVDYIEEHFSEEVSISGLSALCHMCESGFFRQFRRATGVTPIAYKHNIMIQNALDMLSHTDLTIEEISARVGFSSSNYFRKVFFDITGKTPREVR